MKCNAEICSNYNPDFPFNCVWHDAVELDLSGRCDCFVLADDALIYEEIAKEKYEIVQQRRKASQNA